MTAVCFVYLGGADAAALDAVPEDPFDFSLSFSLDGAVGLVALFCFVLTVVALLAAAGGALPLGAAAVREVLLLGDCFPFDGFPLRVLPAGLDPVEGGLAVGGGLL